MAGELEVRPDRFQAYVGGESLELTRREFELLQVLADHGGKVMERDEIYQHVWGYAMIHGDRSVDVFVRKLRSKLQKRSPGWEYIHTHFGIGYRFDPQPLGSGAASPRSRRSSGRRRPGPSTGRARRPPGADDTGRPARTSPPGLRRAHSRPGSAVAHVPGRVFQGRSFTGCSQVGHRAVTGARWALGRSRRQPTKEI